MNATHIYHKPVELLFRKCIIKKDEKTGEKYVYLIELPFLERHEIVFDASLYEVGTSFYAYLIENKYFSGLADDYRCTLVNISYEQPRLKGKKSIGSILFECSSGTGKPPYSAYRDHDTYKSYIEYKYLITNSESSIFAEIIKQYSQLNPDLLFKHISLVLNDFGVPNILFSDVEIIEWDRIETTNLNLTSTFGINYLKLNSFDKSYNWLIHANDKIQSH